MEQSRGTHLVGRLEEGRSGQEAGLDEVGTCGDHLRRALCEAVAGLQGLQ